MINSCVCVRVFAIGHRDCVAGHKDKDETTLLREWLLAWRRAKG